MHRGIPKNQAHVSNKWMVLICLLELCSFGCSIERRLNREYNKFLNTYSISCINNLLKTVYINLSYNLLIDKSKHSISLSAFSYWFSFMQNPFWSMMGTQFVYSTFTKIYWYLKINRVFKLSSVLIIVNGRPRHSVRKKRVAITRDVKVKKNGKS